MVVQNIHKIAFLECTVRNGSLFFLQDINMDDIPYTIVPIKLSNQLITSLTSNELSTKQKGIP